MTLAGRYAEEGPMGGKIRSAISNGQLRRLMGGTLAALSASAALVMVPTKASAFDIGGMIGTAMAIQMQMHGYRGISGGYGHARNRGESHGDSDSDGSSSRGSGERDASAPDAVDRSTRSDNRRAMHREIGARPAPRAAWRRPLSAMRRPIRGLAPVGRSTTSRRSNRRADRQSLSRRIVGTGGLRA